jgi:hypothetical protein
MGEVVELRPRESGEPAPRRRRSKREREGYLLVPTRILKSLAQLEQSIQAIAAHIPYEHADKFDWAAYYALLACLEMSTRYEQ